MAKLYARPSKEKILKLDPKEETIRFLLNYSKALKITNYGKMQFESLLN